MRIGFLVGSVSRDAGGLLHSVQGLAKAVMSLNPAVDVFSIQDERTAVDAAKWEPIQVHAFPPHLRSWGYARQLLPALVDANLDVLLTHGLWKYGSVAADTWHNRTGRPYIIHPHGMLDAWALRHSGWKKRIAGVLYENRHLRGATCLRALSEAEAQSIGAYGLHNPICMIPNGVELPQLAGSSKLRVENSALGRVAQNRKILLYLG